MAGARRMPCGYSAKIWGAHRAPAAAIFFSSPGGCFGSFLRSLSRLPALHGLLVIHQTCQPSTVRAPLKPCRAAGRSADGPTGSAPSSGLRSRCAGAPHPAPPNERLRTAPLIERGCEHDLIGHDDGDNFFVVPARQRCGSDSRRERGPTSRQDPSPSLLGSLCGSQEKQPSPARGEGATAIALLGARTWDRGEPGHVAMGQPERHRAGARRRTSNVRCRHRSRPSP